MAEVLHMVASQVDQSMAKLAFIFKDQDFVKDWERKAYLSLQIFDVNLCRENMAKDCVISSSIEHINLQKQFELRAHQYTLKDKTLHEKNGYVFSFEDEQTAHMVVSLII